MNKILLDASGYDAMFFGTTLGFLVSGLMLLGLAFIRREESPSH